MFNAVKKHYASPLVFSMAFGFALTGSGCGKDESVEHEIVYRHAGLLEFCNDYSINAYKAPGSVPVTRGERYSRMLAVCQREHGPSWVPDENSVSRKRCEGAAFVYGFKCKQP